MSVKEPKAAFYFILSLNFIFSAGPLWYLSFIWGGYGRGNYRMIIKNHALSCAEYDGFPMPESEKEIPLVDNRDWALLLEFKIANGKEAMTAIPAVVPNGNWR